MSSKQINNVKISLRKDELSNWLSSNPVLRSGELAIVIDEEGKESIKIGNGLSSFSQLPFLYQQEVKTDKILAKEINAKSISQGYSVKSTPTSIATGVFTHADGNFDVVHGIEAKAKEGDDFAFVFNGVNLPLDDQNFYESHGEGTFNVNPKDGLSGFFVGEQSLSGILSRYITEHQSLSDYYQKSETSSSQQISSSIQVLSGTYLRLSSEQPQLVSSNIEMEGFLRVGGITVQGRKFVETAYSLIPPAMQSSTRIGQVYCMISTDFSGGYLQGHLYQLTADTSGQNLGYKDITDLNEVSVTYHQDIEDLTFDSHVGSAQYSETDQDLEIQVLRM